MTMTFLDGPARTGAMPLAAMALLRAALGLVALGITGFGRPAMIDRRTGKVRLQ